MGFGDDIMATALARKAIEQSPNSKVVFGNPDTYHNHETNTLDVHWSEVFLNNPNIAQPEELVSNFICIPDYPGNRQSISYADTVTNQEKTAYSVFAWTKDFHAPKGELFFSNDELLKVAKTVARLPRKFVVIEPNVMTKDWINHKGWNIDNWKAVVKSAPYIPFVQLGAPQSKSFDGMAHLDTISFREACVILSFSSGYIGTDGGLHHAAAALNIPATVLWGHYSSPEVFGYKEHQNIRYSDGRGCGSIGVECPECPKSMENISVREVVDNLKKMYEKETGITENNAQPDLKKHSHNPVTDIETRYGTREINQNIRPIKYYSEAENPECMRMKEIIRETQCRSMLEIGSLWGWNYYHLASTMPIGSKIRSIDLQGHDDFGNKWDWYNNTNESLLQFNQELNDGGWDSSIYLGDSHGMEAIQFGESEGPYDLVYIDGDHSYEGVKADWKNFGKLATKVIGFHDIDNPNMGVKQFWNELKNAYRHEEIILISNENKSHRGIGIIYLT